ncbi:MAG: uridine diphosphate-N-acetylglucosamine-binding protein YvcK, partial [Anaerolineales bacterium]
MKKTDWQNIRHWLRPGIRVKRWVLLCAVGMVLLGAALAQGIALLRETGILDTWTDVLLLTFLPPAWRVLVFFILGACLVAVALYELYHAVIRPLAEQQNRPWLDMLVRYNRLQRGQHVVVIGGGTGLPSVLRGMKAVTNNITAVVTMADDGGSSGRLRRELGVPPPGDLRNNIAALSDDEDMMTRLFQYRFSDGALGGHSFGNLFLTALSDITGNMDAAVAVAGRVLAITGRVLPSTLHNVNLVADIRTPAGRRMRVYGESNIATAGGTIERVMLEPMSVPALPEVIRAILNADL